MSVYTLVIIALILVFALMSGLVIPVGVNPLLPLAFIASMAILGSILVALSHTLESYLHEVLLREFRRAGYTMPVQYSRLLTIAFLVALMSSFSLLALLYTLILSPGVSITIVRVLLALSLIALISGLVTLTLVVILSPRIITSFRASGALVELPFLLATLRVFSKTHLTLYDIFKMVENSVTLRWWANEVKHREVLARERGISLLTSIGLMAEDHPSLEVRDVIRRIALAGSYAGSPAGVVDRISEQYFELLRVRLERLTGYMYIALGIVLVSLFLIPVLGVTLGPVLRIQPSMIALIAVVTAAPIFLIAYMLIQALYPSGFMLNPPMPVRLTYTLSILVTLGVLFSSLYAITRGIQFNIMIAYAIMLSSLLPPIAMTSAYMARVSAYERLVRVIADATELASVTGENLVSLMRRISGGDKRVSRLIDGIERAVVDDVYRVRIVSEAPNMLYASMMENLVYALRIGAPLPVFSEIASVYERLRDTLGRHQSTMRGVELTLAVIILAISTFTGLMTRILSGIAESIKTPTGVSIPSILQQFAITSDPLMIYATLTSIIVAGLVTGALVEKAKNGTLMTSARVTLTYVVLALIGIILLSIAEVMRTLPLA